MSLRVLLGKPSGGLKGLADLLPASIEIVTFSCTVEFFGRTESDHGVGERDCVAYSRIQESGS
jgi:hypothetical protein